jgi:hypothetical protein
MPLAIATFAATVGSGDTVGLADGSTDGSVAALREGASEAVALDGLGVAGAGVLLGGEAAADGSSVPSDIVTTTTSSPVVSDFAMAMA